MNYTIAEFRPSVSLEPVSEMTSVDGSNQAAAKAQLIWALYGTTKARALIQTIFEKRFSVNQWYGLLMTTPSDTTCPDCGIEMERIEEATMACRDIPEDKFPKCKRDTDRGRRRSAVEDSVWCPIRNKRRSLGHDSRRVARNLLSA